MVIYMSDRIQIIKTKLQLDQEIFTKIKLKIEEKDRIGSLSPRPI